VVSLFTKVPLNDTLQLLEQHFNSRMTEFFPASAHFDIFSLQRELLLTDRWRGHGPLAPIVANFFMEYFKETALRAAQYKLTHWIRYVDTFVV
jgi:hypothetical protein